VWRNSANLCARRALGAYVPLVGGLVAAPTSAVSSLRDQRAEIFLAFLLPSPPRGGWVGSRNYCLLCVAAHCVLPHAERKEPSSPFSRRSERLLGARLLRAMRQGASFPFVFLPPGSVTGRLAPRSPPFPLAYFVAGAGWLWRVQPVIRSILLINRR